MERELEEKIRENPSSRLFALLADSYRKKGRIEQAVRTLLKGLTVHPTYISARVLLARCYADLGEWPRAGEEWQKILELEPGNLVALRGMGETSLRLGMLEDARRWYGSYLEEIPDDPEIRERLQVIAEDIEERTAQEGPEEAIGATIAEAVPEGPGRDAGPPEPERPSEPVGPSAPSGILEDEELGPIEEDLGEEYGGEEPVETMTLAEIYAQQGFFERAIGIYRKILALDPNSHCIQERINELRGKLEHIPPTDSAPRETEAESRLKPNFLRKRIEEGEGCERVRSEESIEAGFQVDINRVSRSELEKIPGIGPIIAQKILLERERNGPFTCLEDLERVPNLGEKTIERIHPYLIFGREIPGEGDRQTVPGEEIPQPVGEVRIVEPGQGAGGGERAEGPDEDGVDSEFEEFRRWLKNLRK